MAVNNWNGILSNTRNLNDVLIILRKVLAQLSNKIDVTQIDEVIQNLEQTEKDVLDDLESLKSALNAINEQGGWYKPYLTEEELLEDKPDVSFLLAKALDTKKTWYWDGTTWTDTGLSELDQAIQYTDGEISKSFDEIKSEINNLSINSIMYSAFYTYESIGMSSVILDKNNRILLPTKMVNSNIDISANNIQEADFNSLYLNADVVKKRYNRHPIQNISQTPEYWRNSVQKLYDQYDRLVNDYPDYVSRNLLGYEPTGLPIYAYNFTPAKKLLRVHQQDAMEYPKVLVIGGVHGNERGSQITNITFFSMLCDDYLNSEVLTYFRHNIDFHIIPASNAWGVENTKRFNSNYVDLNRNYDSNWSAGSGIVSGEEFTYGSSAFSEVESRIIRDYVLSHYDASIVLDTHDGGSPDYFSWIATMHPKLIEVFKKSSYEIITMIYQDLHPKNMPQYPLLFAGHEDGTMTKWAMMQGIKSGLMEVNGDNSNFNDDVNIKRDIFIKIFQNLIKNSVDSYINDLIIGAKNA